MERKPEDIPADTLVAAMVYLMTRYERTRCRWLALRIAQHMQWLAIHPEAGAALRDACAALHGAWARSAAAPVSERLADRVH
ncbi:MAG: hypothetical protein ACT4P3_07365 [Betaproteobacteria bacterium]